MTARRSLQGGGYLCSPCLFRRHLSSTLTARFSSLPVLARQYAFPPTSPRLEDAHTTAAAQNEHGSFGGSESSEVRQEHPLSGYYFDILKTRSPYPDRATSSRPVVEPATTRQGKPTPSATVEPQSPQDKMSIVFGSRLAGPGYRSTRYHPDTTPPESTWKTVNGVAIPPRPVEPDNCCMSGCVHCVWDDYREHMEEWAARLERAKAKGQSKCKKADIHHAPRGEVDSASQSMDDDGGGSETNWTPPNAHDHLFAEIPVGIREFMKTEKNVRKKKEKEGVPA